MINKIATTLYDKQTISTTLKESQELPIYSIKYNFLLHSVQLTNDSNNGSDSYPCPVSEFPVSFKAFSIANNNILGARAYF